MANAQVLAEKKAAVSDITDKLRNAASGVLVDYKGVNVSEDTDLRRAFRKADVEYKVIKNTLLRFAMNEVGFGEFDPLLNGTTSIAISQTDAIAPARIVNEFSKKLGNRFEIKGGFVEGRIMSILELTALADIPSKEALQAQVLGTMLAPITSLAVVLGQILEQKQSGSDAPVEAAPVVEAAPAEAEAPAEAPAEAAPADEAPAEEATEESSEEEASVEEAPAE